VRSARRPSGVQRLVKIGPIRVHLLDGRQLPQPRPMLDRLLALNGRADVFVEFVIDQPFQAMLLGETFGQPFAVFICAPRQIGGDADIERSVAPIRHDVNVAALHTKMSNDLAAQSYPDRLSLVTLVPGLDPGIDPRAQPATIVVVRVRPHPGCAGQARA